MKRRKELTPEQMAARDERKAKFKALVKQISDMSDTERQAFAARCPAIVTVDGNALSQRNCMLVMKQLGAATTVVGGFRQWKANGRAVIKGQHGATIWVPTVKRDKTGGSDDELQPEDAGELRFITGTVFDISQTQPLELALDDSNGWQRGEANHSDLSTPVAL